MLKKEKPKEVEKLVNLIKGYSVIGILNMHAMPAKQLQKIRDALRDKAKIRMSKKNLIKKAFEKAKINGIDKLEKYLKGELSLILTNENPFKLYKYLKKNKTPAAAKAGQVATKDILIEKGPTQFSPGPAISTLQKIGLKTTVQNGKIAILKDKVVCKKGEEITPEMVDVFSLLKIEPMEIGLELEAVLENGTVYDKNVLNIDEEEYLNKLTRAIHQAVNLSVGICYPTPLTIELIVAKCFAEAKTLAIEASIFDKEIIGDLILKAIQESEGISQKINYSNKKLR